MNNKKTIFEKLVDLVYGHYINVRNENGYYYMTIDFEDRKFISEDFEIIEDATIKLIKDIGQYYKKKYLKAEDIIDKIKERK